MPDDRLVEVAHLAVAVERDAVAAVAVVSERDTVEADAVTLLHRVVRRGDRRDGGGRVGFRVRPEPRFVDPPLVTPDPALLPRHVVFGERAVHARPGRAANHG